MVLCRNLQRWLKISDICTMSQDCDKATSSSAAPDSGNFTIVPDQASMSWICKCCLPVAFAQSSISMQLHENESTVDSHCWKFCTLTKILMHLPSETNPKYFHPARLFLFPFYHCQTDFIMSTISPFPLSVFSSIKPKNSLIFLIYIHCHWLSFHAESYRFSSWQLLLKGSDNKTILASIEQGFSSV